MLFLLVGRQGRRNGNLEILVAEGTGRTWSVPAVLFPDTAADVSPSLFAERNAVSLGAMSGGNRTSVTR